MEKLNLTDVIITWSRSTKDGECNVAVLDRNQVSGAGSLYSCTAGSDWGCVSSMDQKDRCLYALRIAFKMIEDGVQAATAFDEMLKIREFNIALNFDPALFMMQGIHSSEEFWRRVDASNRAK